MGEVKRHAAELRKWLVPASTLAADERPAILRGAALALMDRNPALAVQRLDAYTARQSLPTTGDLDGAPGKVSIPLPSMMAAFFIAVPFAIGCVALGIGVAVLIGGSPVVGGGLAGLGALAFGAWSAILQYSRRQRRAQATPVKEWVQWYQDLPQSLRHETQLVVAKPAR